MTETTDKSRRKHEGQYKKGQSGNVAGRPVGAMHPNVRLGMQLLKEESPALARMIVNLAKDENISAIKIIADRIFPICKEMPLDLEDVLALNTDNLYESVNTILRLISTGKLCLSDGERLLGALNTGCNIILGGTLEAKVDHLTALVSQVLEANATR